MTYPNYLLLDSGEGRKLERFGSIVLERPCAGAVWRQALPPTEWEMANAAFLRDPESRWQSRTKLPESWTVEASGIKFKLQATEFGHLGIFPEQKTSWEWIRETVAAAHTKSNPVRVLNLFAYSGGSTLAAAQGGAEVCHLDASKGMVAWARENAALNGLADAPIRWIVDDVTKFLKRELRRESCYEGIILDPPTFGRGRQGEVFKIETDLMPLLEMCRELLSEKPRFILFSCHTPGFTPSVMRHLLENILKGLPGMIETGEMLLEGEKNVFAPPSGCYARWVSDV